MKYYYLTKDLTEHDAEKFDVCYLKNTITTQKIEVFFLRTKKRLIVLTTDLMAFDHDDTGDSKKNKICDRCHKYLPTDNFDNNRIKKGGKITKRPSCKPCRRIKDGKNLSSKQKKEFQVTTGEVGDFLECPICQKSGIVGVKKFVIDHNHTTGEIRGYICESCNTGLGRFDDKIEILERAIEWLKGNISST